MLLGRLLGLLARFGDGEAALSLESSLSVTYKQYCEYIRDDIPPVLVSALIAVEDRRFYTHGGFDPLSAFRALFQGISKGAWTGASTLEQQLVRTLTNRRERTFRRKLHEILCACRVHEVVPKNDVPGVYLSVAYFGWEMDGLVEGCRQLEIDIRRTTPPQAAEIVARLKYPEPKHLSHQRRNQIENRAKQVLRLISVYESSN